MTQNTKILIAVLAVAVLLGVIYMMFFSSTPGGSAVSSSGNSPSSPAEVNFLNLSSQIEPITFDTSILSDPRFTALVDIHTAVLPEATGRTDPFAPIGSGN